jgi:importin subunit beta-1
MAFGAILEGPDPSNLKPLVEEAMPMLIELMKDESVAVKDTAAWTIGRVCELVSFCYVKVRLGYIRLG